MSAPAASSVRIDQVFHGYDRGHKELASSILLDEDSRATMLVYSDLLADLGDGKDASYLACYPLPSASRHVLARTWLAGAGYRPGSVWTHSLVLDYQALALFADLVALEPLLMSSGEIERGRSIKPLLVHADLTADGPFEIKSPAEIAVEGLYGRSHGDVVVPTRNRSENDLLALSLWRQMWPRLRREFSFITAIGASRPVVGSDWILKFAREQSYDVKLNPGLQALLDDLPVPGQTPLRSFLSRYAVEASDPRRIAGPLAKLWAMPTVGFGDRLRVVRELTDDVPLPRLTRDLISAELDAAADPTVLLAVLKEFGGQPLDVDSSRVVRMAEAMDTGSFRLLLSLSAASSSDHLGGRVFEAAVRGADLHRLVEASEAADRATMLRLRPELVDVFGFWPEDDAARAALIKGYGGDLVLEKGWELFGREIGQHTAEALLERALDPPVPVLLKLLAEGSAQVARLVAVRVVANPSLTETLLEVGDARALGYLADAQIASALPPFSPLAWCAAVRRIGGEFLAPALLVTCYVACLALRGDEGLAAARQVYDPLQRLVRKYRLSGEQERYLEGALTSEGGKRRLAHRLLKSALAQWPPEGANARALTLSNEYNHFCDLVEEAIDLFGKWRLREASLDPNLPPEVRSYIKQRLEASTKWSWWF